MTDEELLEFQLADQIEDFEEPVVKSTKKTRITKKEVVEDEKTTNDASSFIGKQLSIDPLTGRTAAEKKKEQDFKTKLGLTKIGESLDKKTEFRDGWLPFDKTELGERAMFYPKTWEFRIRPATVEAIRSWSQISEEDVLSVDTAAVEIIKSCLSIVDAATGLPVKYGNINAWDRFFFLLRIREYTMAEGEHKISYEQECPDCENPIIVELTSDSLVYDMPDSDVIKYFDKETMTWIINPQDFDVDADPIQLYLPTLDKEQAIKEWMREKYTTNQNYKPDTAFISCLLWMAPKLSKDSEMRKKQIKGYEMTYKGWDAEMFMFVDEVIRNITVTTGQFINVTCPTCGEEVRSKIQFQFNIRDLFNISSRHKKFGSK